MSYDTPDGQEPKMRARPLNEVFPAAKIYPLMPPPEFWLRRHHWLVDPDGMLMMAHWHWRMGWDFDLGGKPDPEDLEGWRYYAPVNVPVLDAITLAGEVWPRATHDSLADALQDIADGWQARALMAENLLKDLAKVSAAGRTAELIRDMLKKARGK